MLANLNMDHVITALNINKMNRIIFLATSMLIIISNINLFAQSSKYKTPLTLEFCIEKALEGSIEAQDAENKFIADSWEYKLYKISRLPSFSLQSTPIQYNSNFTQRYDFDKNIDVYRQQNSIYSSLGLSIKQNISLTGGTLSLDTNLDYINNTEVKSYSQFSSVPIRIGYNQSVFGFNSFKWNKKIEPLKYRIAEKRYLYTLETVVEKVALLFLDYAIAYSEYKMAVETMMTADSLYKYGLDQNMISAISKADMNILDIDRLNARNSVKTATAVLEKAGLALAFYMSVAPETVIGTEVVFPIMAKENNINIDLVTLFAMENNPEELTNEQTILQAEMDVERTKRESGFNANISASVGFNQVANQFLDVYSNLSRQSVVGINISIPIFDWGNRKGRLSIASANLKSVQLSVDHNRNNIHQELEVVVKDLFMYRDMISTSDEIVKLAQSAYEITKNRFLVGKADLNSLTLAQTRKIEAKRNYLLAFRGYWAAYYKIRRMTLYDFDNEKIISIHQHNHK